MLNLRGEVEADILEVLLGQGEGVARVGQEDIAAMLIDSHVGMLTALEITQLLLIVTLNPASLVDRNRLPAARAVKPALYQKITFLSYSALCKPLGLNQDPATYHTLLSSNSMESDSNAPSHHPSQF